MTRWLLLLALGGCADLIGITEPRDLAVVELTASVGTLTPAFDPAITAYRLELVHANGAVEFHAEANDPQAAIDIAGMQSIDGTHSVAIPIGDSTVDVVAHTQSGVRVTYRVEVSRPDIVIAFAPPRSVQTQVPGMIDRVAVGDYDGNGSDDLAAITGVGDIATMTNDGTGVFQPKGMHPYGFVRSVVSADLDRDGKPELVVTAGDLRIAPGIGGGSFAAPFGCGGGMFGAAALFHLDGDDRLDLAVVDQTGRLAIFRASPAAGLACFEGLPALDQYPATSELAAIAAGELDSAPGEDLATLDASARKIFIHRNQASSISTTAITLPPGAQPVELAVADLDGLAGDELIWIDRANDDVVVQPTSGPPRGSYHADGNPRSMRVADVDGDGRRDVIVLVDTGIVVMHNDGTGGLRPKPIAMQMPGVVRISTGDFNGDGRADLVTANFTSTLLVHLGVAP